MMTAGWSIRTCSSRDKTKGGIKCKTKHNNATIKHAHWGACLHESNDQNRHVIHSKLAKCRNEATDFRAMNLAHRKHAIKRRRHNCFTRLEIAQ